MKLKKSNLHFVVISNLVMAFPPKSCQVSCLVHPDTRTSLINEDTKLEGLCSCAI